MEVLSIGEKIKRARVYKGYTLKDVCGDKISVSKLSCIENGKIAPEKWVLEYISGELNLDIDYINESVKKQINKNIKAILKNNESENYPKDLKYNLMIAEKYQYYEVAINIMHYIFSYYINKNELEEARKLIGNYYDVSNKTTDNYYKYFYYMDIGSFFYKNGEFYQASIYFRNIRKYASIGEDNELIAHSIYNEINCYIKMEYFSDAYKLATKLQMLLSYVSSKSKKAKIYKILAVLALRKNDDKFLEYQKYTYELYEGSKEKIAKAMLDFAITSFVMKKNEKGIEYIKEGIRLYPHNDRKKLVEFMIKCTEEFIKNDILDEAEILVETTLNYSIKLDDVRFIEKAYYLKALLLKRQNKLVASEMYMNLSLDSLVKFGTKKDVYDRYMIMGEMYYNIGSVKESLKYFTLAMTLHKKL